LSRLRQDAILKRAIELADEEEVHAEQIREREAVFEVASEFGVTPEHLERAEKEVIQQHTHRRRRRWAIILAVVMAVIAGVFIVSASAYNMDTLANAPVVPWTDTMSKPGLWQLDTSFWSKAALRWEVVPDRGQVAVVEVQQVHEWELTEWHFDLERELTVGSAYRGMTIELQGTLPAARVDLYAGRNERWRTPLIAVQATWRRHRIPFTDLEHQRRRAGRWQTVVEPDRQSPADADMLLVRLGHFVNTPNARGIVRVAEFGLE